ncbi:GNAT family N-acetyltransferase [Bifidobacterium tissieri]|uniref:GNAT family N-acetyltransferase n=1 Tax=Bifidobacterium tissieri TaxID=1630162 RepID=A0A5M9ZXY2_9BIFI|nr:GNAT family N-acetyltransferase [Bifidobacterium tissieri]KAA8831525.1 GNAT family N-acetyltransferase [Bifidobacterium tissieri]KAA8832491.1 GNAT family N-acetyltransferase [Bifidobacterium tissieri]
MSSQAVLRAMRAEDMPRIEEIVCRTWGYDVSMSARNAALLGRIDAYECLSRRTYMRVADVDGEVAGLIVAADRRHPHIDRRMRLMQLGAVCGLLTSREGRQGLGMFRQYMAADKELSRDAESQGKRYDGELVLFIVDGQYRGYGLGRMLFDDAMRYFHDQGIDDFFLYTDTGCDFGFYGHRGMTRRCARSVSFPIGDRIRTEEMYIYDDTVSHQISDYGEDSR